MNFFGNILASTYTYYSKKKKTDAYFDSRNLLGIIISIFLMLLLAIAGHLFKFNAYKKYPNFKLATVVGFYIIIFGVFRYYPKAKMDNYIQAFNLKSKFERQIWGIITVICSVLPLLLLFLVLILERHK